MRLSSTLLVSIALSAAFVGAASAQIERIPPQGEVGGPGGGENLDVRFIKSGALLIASFDADHDLIVTSEEIKAGARLSFKVADENTNNSMSPIEQRNWAAKIASERDVLGNPTLFASAVPGQVTIDEFEAGLLTFSERFQDQEGVIRFRDMTVQAGSRPDRGQENEQPRRPPPRTRQIAERTGQGS